MAETAGAVAVAAVENEAAVDEAAVDEAGLVLTGRLRQDAEMTRNPFSVGLVVAGCVLTLTYLVLFGALALSVLDYTPYDEGAALAVSLMVVVTAVAAAGSFAGAAVLGGLAWSPRLTVEAASTHRRRNPYTIGLLVAGAVALMVTAAVAAGTRWDFGAVSYPVLIEVGSAPASVDPTLQLAYPVIYDYLFLATAAVCTMVALLGAVILSGATRAHARAGAESAVTHGEPVAAA